MTIALMASPTIAENESESAAEPDTVSAPFGVAGPSRASLASRSKSVSYHANMKPALGGSSAMHRRISIQPKANVSINRNVFEGTTSSEVAEPHSKRLNETQDSLKMSAESLLDEIYLKLQPFENMFGSPVIAELFKKFRHEFDGLYRTQAQIVKDFADSQLVATKQALKGQADKYETKLETARKAAAMRLKNQAVEMEAVAARKLEDTVNTFSNSGTSELAEAMKRAEELSKHVHFQTVRANKTEDMLKATQKQLDRAEHRAELWQKELDAFRVEADESKRLLQDALSSLGIKIEENRSLAEQVGSLIDAMSHNGSGADLLFQQRQNALEEAKEATVRAEAAEKEAALQTQRAEEAHSKADSRFSDMRIRMEVERDMMRRTCFEIENQFVASAIDFALLTKELMPLEMELAEVKQMGSEAGGDLFSTRQRVKELEREVTETRATLTNALQDLHVFEDENQSLSQQIKELVTSYQDGKVTNGVLQQRVAELTQQMKEQGAQSARAASQREKTLNAQLAMALKQLEDKGTSITADQLVRWQCILESLVVSRSAMKTSILTTLQGLDGELKQPTNDGAALELPTEENALNPVSNDEEPSSDTQVALINQHMDALQEGDSSQMFLLDNLLDRLSKTAGGFERMRQDCEHAQAALENAVFEVDQVTDRANERLRKLKQRTQEERATLVRAALGSLQQLRSHLTYMFSGLKLSFPDEQLAKEGFAWRQKRSRWGVTSHSGDSVVIRLDTSISEIKRQIHHAVASDGRESWTLATSRAAPHVGTRAMMPTPPNKIRSMVNTPRGQFIGSVPGSANVRRRADGDGFDIATSTPIRRPASAHPALQEPEVISGTPFTPDKASAPSQADPAWLEAVIHQSGELMASPPIDTMSPRMHRIHARSARFTAPVQLPRSYVSSLPKAGAPDANIEASHTELTKTYG